MLKVAISIHGQFLHPEAKTRTKGKEIHTYQHSLPGEGNIC
jgi:hypothetical protein